MSCRTCASLFRHPILPQTAYERLYASGAPMQWSDNVARADFRVVAGFIARSSDALRILDVGCGTGEFLASLPASLRKFGVEPSGAAAEAGRHGIEIIARDLGDVSSDRLFDVITIIDFIEHVAKPAALLERAFSLLSPGGEIIISSGDPGFPLWKRFFRSRFWYSGFPEHISFPSIEFYRQWSRRSGASLECTTRFRYQPASLQYRALALLIQMAYFLSPGAFNLIGRAIGRLMRAEHPRQRQFSAGVPGLFADHHVVRIGKPLNSG